MVNVVMKINRINLAAKVTNMRGVSLSCARALSLSVYIYIHTHKHTDIHMDMLM